MFPNEELLVMKAELSGGTRTVFKYGEVVGTEDAEESIGYLRKIMATANTSKLHMVHATTEKRGDVAIAVVFDGPDGPDNVRRIAVALNVSEMLVAEVERLRKVEAAAREYRSEHRAGFMQERLDGSRNRLFAALDAAQGDV